MPAPIPFLPADVGFPESVPAAEDMPDLLEHVFGEEKGIRVIVIVQGVSGWGHHFSRDKPQFFSQIRRSMTVRACLAGFQRIHFPSKEEEWLKVAIEPTPV